MLTEVRSSPSSRLGMTLVNYLLAFGAFARLLPDKEEYSSLISVNAGLELCDSLTLDGHKLLNVVSSPSHRLEK